MQAASVTKGLDLCSSYHSSSQVVKDELRLNCHMSQKTLIPAHRPENIAKAKLAENWRLGKRGEQISSHQIGSNGYWLSFHSLNVLKNFVKQFVRCDLVCFGFKVEYDTMPQRWL